MCAAGFGRGGRHRDQRRIRRFFANGVQALEVKVIASMLTLMKKGENDFKVKVGRMGQERSSLAWVRSTVRQRIQGKVRPKIRIAPKTGMRAHFRPGSAGRGARPAMSALRGVSVTARYIMHGATKGASLRTQIRYLRREGVVPQRGEPELNRSAGPPERADASGRDRFAFYDRSQIDVDGKAVTAGWTDDNRHFRLIIAAADGEGLGDLKPFIREVMSVLERRMGTRLEWLAMDHWDTASPHTHVLLRGRRAEGEDLFIPSRVLWSGIREHAREIVTRLLGPPHDDDLWRDHWREVSHMRVTPLDLELEAARDGAGVIRVYQPHLLARLEHLESWELAGRTQGGWRMSSNLLGELKSIAEHQAIERAVSPHRRPGELLPLLAASPSEAIEGQLVHYGPPDETDSRYLAVIETAKGELRYARIAREADPLTLDGIVPGTIVALEPSVPGPKPTDHAIAAIAAKTGGLYSAAHHRWISYGVSEALIDANIRRLEAMRQVNLIARDEGGAFLVGHNHLERAHLFEESVARRYPIMAGAASYWTLEEQVTALGPTRLDRILAGEAAQPEGGGAFARRYAFALQQRRLFLLEQGWLGRLSPRPAIGSSLNRLR